MDGDVVQDTEDVLDVPAQCSHILDQLNSLRCNQSMCDAVVTSQEKSIPVHRLLLTATSPYFAKCLQSMSDGNFVFNLSHIDSDILEIIVNFVYTSKLTVSKDSVDNVKQICEELELSHAVKACDDYQKFGIQRQLDASVQTEEIESHNALNVEDDVPVKKKRKIGAAKVQDKKDDVGKVVKNAAKRKIAKAAPKELRKAARKKETLKPRKPRKPAEPKQRKVQQRMPDTIPPKYKDELVKEVNNSSAVKNDKSIDGSVSGDGPDPTVIKIEREDGDVEVWGADADDQDDFDDNDDSDTDDGDVVDEVGDEGNASDLFKTVDDEGRVVKIRSKQKNNDPKRPVIKKIRRRKPFPCTMCSKTLTSKKRLIFHEYSRHGTPIDYKNINFTVSPCDVEGCNYVAANRHNLDMHMKSRHGEARPHVCEFCGKAFKLPNILATHLNIHTGSKIWKCTECGEHFNQQSGLQVHKKRYHMGEASWTEMCHMCSEKFLQKADLAWHLYKVHGQPLPDNYKMYTCDICGFSTMKYQQLKQHRERHDGIKNFTCPICQKGCSTKSELRRHVSFHGEKKYKCTFEGCSYACTDTIGLDKHIKLMHTHKDFKPYACPVCQYRTGVKGNVDKHIRTVHDLIVVTKHTVNLKMKYSNFDSGDVITKDGRLVATAKERKALQLVPTIDKEIGMHPNSETVSSVNNLTYADYKVKETADNNYSNIKKSKRHKGYRVELQTGQHTELIKPSIPTVVNDSADGSKMETIINDLPPLNNYVYIHDGEVGAPQDLRLQGVNQTSESASLYTIGNADMFGLHNKY